MGRHIDPGGRTEEFGGVDAELISTNLSAEQEAKLREAFASED